MELDDQLAQDVDFIVIARQPIVTNVLSRNEKQYDACFKISYNIT